MVQALQQRLDEQGLAGTARAALQLLTARVWLAQQPSASAHDSAAAALQAAAAELAAQPANSYLLAELGTLHASMALAKAALPAWACEASQADAEEQAAAREARLASGRLASVSGRQHSGQALDAWQAAAAATGAAAAQQRWASSAAALQELAAMLALRGPSKLAAQAHSLLVSMQEPLSRSCSSSTCSPLCLAGGLSCSPHQPGSSMSAAELRAHALAQPPGPGCAHVTVQRRAEAHLRAAGQWLTQGARICQARQTRPLP